VKVLGQGEISKAITVRAHRFSKQAAEKIKNAGGTTELIEEAKLLRRAGGPGGAAPLTEGV
jgi:ribosomal protein L18E